MRISQVLHDVPCRTVSIPWDVTTERIDDPGTVSWGRRCLAASSFPLGELHAL
ncbi:MAG: hypothetical protein ACLFS8_07230 [Clostridia bacterium]